LFHLLAVTEYFDFLNSFIHSFLFSLTFFFIPRMATPKRVATVEGPASCLLSGLFL
jgi:hypothetical protein